MAKRFSSIFTSCNVGVLYSMEARAACYEQLFYTNGEQGAVILGGSRRFWYYLGISRIDGSVKFHSCNLDVGTSPDTGENWTGKSMETCVENDMVIIVTSNIIQNMNSLLLFIVGII